MALKKFKNNIDFSLGSDFDVKSYRPASFSTNNNRKNLTTTESTKKITEISTTVDSASVLLIKNAFTKSPQSSSTPIEEIIAAEEQLKGPKKVTLAEYKKRKISSVQDITEGSFSNFSSLPNRASRLSAASFIPMLKDLPSTSQASSSSTIMLSTTTTPDVHSFEGFRSPSSSTQPIDLDELKERIYNPKKTTNVSRVCLFF